MAVVKRKVVTVAGAIKRVRINRTAVPTKRAAVVEEEIFIPDSLRQFLRPIDSLRLWRENPRENKQAAEDLAKLIREYGFRVPMIIDTDGNIRTGNTRYKAAKLLGMKEVPAIPQEFVADGEAERFAVSDNKASEFASWDDELLAKLLKKDTFVGYTGELGFSSEEVRGIFMEPDVDKVERIAAKNSALRARIIVIVVNAAQREGIAGMIQQWGEANKLSLEVK